MSYEKDNPSGYVSSASASAMIAAALGPYLTSASLATALGPYLTSASAALSTYIKSASLATALAPYLTSASAALSSYVTSASLATADYVTSNSLSAAFASGLNSGVIVLGNQLLAGRTDARFSGSWSHVGVLQLRAIFNCGVTAAVLGVARLASAGTIILEQNTSATASGQQTVMIEITAMGGDGQSRKALSLMTAQSGLNRFAATVTTNSSFINQIVYDNSITMVSGVAFLFGFRNI